MSRPPCPPQSIHLLVIPPLLPTTPDYHPHRPCSPHHLSSFPPPHIVPRVSSPLSSSPRPSPLAPPSLGHRHHPDHPDRPAAVPTCIHLSLRFHPLIFLLLPPPRYHSPPPWPLSALPPAPMHPRRHRPLRPPPLRRFAPHVVITSDCSYAPRPLPSPPRHLFWTMRHRPCLHSVSPFA